MTSGAIGEAVRFICGAPLRFSGQSRLSMKLLEKNKPFLHCKNRCVYTI